MHNNKGKKGSVSGSDSGSLLRNGLSESSAIGQNTPRGEEVKGQRPKPVSESVKTSRGTFPIK